MKDDVKNEVLNGASKILIIFDGVLNKDGVSKSSGRLEGDHVPRFWSWIEKLIAWSLVCKCSYADDIIERRLMMWVSYTINENKQEGNLLAVKCKVLKWAKVNCALLKRSPWWVPMANGMTVTLIFTIMVIIKHGRFKCIKCMNKADELHDVPTCYMKFLKYDSS